MHAGLLPGAQEASLPLRAARGALNGQLARMEKDRARAASGVAELKKAHDILADAFLRKEAEVHPA